MQTKCDFKAKRPNNLKQQVEDIHNRDGNDIHDIYPTPINGQTLDDPDEILENYIKTITNDQNDENVYEIESVYTC